MIKSIETQIKHPTFTVHDELHDTRPFKYRFKTTTITSKGAGIAEKLTMAKNPKWLDKFLAIK